MLRTIVLTTAALTVSVAYLIGLVSPAVAGHIKQVAQGAGSDCPSGTRLKFKYKNAPTARRWVCSGVRPAQCRTGYLLTRRSSLPIRYSCVRTGDPIVFIIPPTCSEGWQLFRANGTCIRNFRLSCPTGYLAIRSWWQRRDSRNLGESIAGRPYCYRPRRGDPKKWPVCNTRALVVLIDKILPSKFDSCRRSRQFPDSPWFFPICTGTTVSKLIIRRGRDFCIDTAIARR